MSIKQQVFNIMLEFGKISRKPTFLEEQCIKAITNISKALVESENKNYKVFSENMLKSMEFYGIIDSSPDASDNKCISKIIAIVGGMKKGDV